MIIPNCILNISLYNLRCGAHIPHQGYFSLQHTENTTEINNRPQCREQVIMGAPSINCSTYNIDSSPKALETLWKRGRKDCTSKPEDQEIQCESVSLNNEKEALL